MVDGLGPPRRLIMSTAFFLSRVFFGLEIQENRDWVSNHPEDIRQPGPRSVHYQPPPGAAFYRFGRFAVRVGVFLKGLRNGVVLWLPLDLFLYL